MENQANPRSQEALLQDERALRIAAEARIRELENQLAEAQRQLGQQKALQEDGQRFRHLMFYCVDWHKNGKDDDAVMLSFGPYASHTLRSSVDKAMAEADSLRLASQAPGAAS